MFELQATFWPYQVNEACRCGLLAEFWSGYADIMNTNYSSCLAYLGSFSLLLLYRKQDIVLGMFCAMGSI